MWQRTLKKNLPTWKTIFKVRWFFPNFNAIWKKIPSALNMGSSQRTWQKKCSKCVMSVKHVLSSRYLMHFKCEKRIGKSQNIGFVLNWLRLSQIMCLYFLCVIKIHQYFFLIENLKHFEKNVYKSQSLDLKFLICWYHDNLITLVNLI